MLLTLVLTLFTCLDVRAEEIDGELAENGISMISQQGDITVYNTSEALKAERNEETIPAGITKFEETDSVIGRDDRLKVTDTSKFPYCAIGLVEVIFIYSDNSVLEGTGTAWMINEHMAITAAHMISSYDSNAQKTVYASQIKFTPGYDGGVSPRRSYFANLVVYNPSYSSLLEADGGILPVTTQKVSEDFALIGFKEDIGSKTGDFGALAMCSEYQNYFKPYTGISTAGYPGYVNNVENTNCYMYSVGGVIRENHITYFTFSNDAGKGQSGSPLFLNNSGEYTYYSIGILSAGDENPNRKNFSYSIKPILLGNAKYWNDRYNRLGNIGG